MIETFVHQSRESLSARRVIIDGSWLSALLGSIIVGSFYYNSEIWYDDYPPEIKAKAPPMSEKAKRERLVVTLSVLLAFIVVPVRSNLIVRRQNNGELSFPSAFLNTYLVLQVFNLFDLVVLDYAWLLGMRPRFTILPGTEGMEAYDDVRRHAILHATGFLKGTLISIIPAALMAWLSTWLGRKVQ